eukprot:m.12758 g.12758  ORF g.12758 m.12758 type:complete len:98 (+) comp6065_c0_seq2:17-310(+)
MSQAFNHTMNTPHFHSNKSNHRSKWFSQIRGISLGSSSNTGSICSNGCICSCGILAITLSIDASLILSLLALTLALTLLLARTLGRGWPGSRLDRGA